MRKNFVRFLIILTGIVVLLMSSCGGNANVKLIRFQPELNKDLSIYKGKKVYLMNFENQAKNTTIWSYSSPDKNMVYGYGVNSLIHNYFWYSFQKAFLTLGVTVTNMDNPDLSAPAMWLTLQSITDEEFTVLVTIQQREQTVFSQQFSTREPPTKSTDREELEKRAYRMTNKLFETILTDPAFQKAFFQTSVGNK